MRRRPPTLASLGSRIGLDLSQARVRVLMVLARYLGPDVSLGCLNLNITIIVTELGRFPEPRNISALPYVWGPGDERGGHGGINGR